MNEGGRGELVALPSGTQVIPHDVSMQYARESARLNASQTVVFDYAAMAAAVASAMDHVQVSVTSNIDGKTAAKAMTPFINRNLGRQRALDERFI